MSTSLKVILATSFVLIIISLPWIYGRAPGGAVLALIDTVWFGGVVVFLAISKKRLL
jgi:hypothetical protein